MMSSLLIPRTSQHNDTDEYTIHQGFITHHSYIAPHVYSSKNNNHR